MKPILVGVVFARGWYLESGFVKYPVRRTCLPKARCHLHALWICGKKSSPPPPPRQHFKGNSSREFWRVFACRKSHTPTCLGMRHSPCDRGKGAKTADPAVADWQYDTGSVELPLKAPAPAASKACSFPDPPSIFRGAHSLPERFSTPNSGPA